MQWKKNGERYGKMTNEDFIAFINDYIGSHTDNASCFEAFVAERGAPQQSTVRVVKNDV